ncbi:MAG TPA: putative baseplate assembly protein, partial [Ilumatobacter sp.]|nr:putative baseplate assembly protein [Ilumatobacter sp.]
MAIAAPNLDDRRFQDLVDDAKRMVMDRCPAWTDHNVSDPGVTLIETFAFMTDQLLFRLNRVPDRLYLKFLDLIGLHLLPPVPANAPVTFWLSAAATSPMTVSVGTNVATPRTETTE